MKLRGFVITLAIILAFLTPITAFAGDYISDAAQSLKNVPVYIAPGTERTDNYTVAKLESVLSANDHIVLVMLPASAEQDLQADPVTIALRLSEKLGNQEIIGLAVGNKVVGYAPDLPIGVDTDQMERAKSVSNDPITALITYAENIHIWQISHPATPTPVPTPTPKSAPVGSTQTDDRSWILILICLVILIACCLAAILHKSSHDQQDSNTRRFQAPSPIDSQLAQIRTLSEQVNNTYFQETLNQLCERVETYFQLSYKEGWIEFFNKRLDEVIQIVQRYLHIQQRSGDYTHPEEAMTRGEDSIKEFSNFVQQSIQEGNDESLKDYEVNTTILGAQKHKEY